MNHDSPDPSSSSSNAASAPQRSPTEQQQQQQQQVHTDDDRRSRRRQRRLRQQQVESSLHQFSQTPSTTAPAPAGDHKPANGNEVHKTELVIMSSHDRSQKRHSETSRPSLSRSPPNSTRSAIRPITVCTAQALIPSTWQDTSERQRKRSTGKITPTVTSPTRTSMTSPTRDKRHSLNSPTVPITGGSNFLTVNPPSDLRVQGTPPGGTRAAIHIIDDFLHNPPQRQRSLTRGGSRGSWKQREREQRTRRLSKTQVTVGLDHLDNLCRLMEQLSSLREENTKLKKRCSFLENTRELLKIQNDMLLHERDDYDSEDEDTLSLGISESTLAESHIELADDDEVFSHTTPGTASPPLSLLASGSTKPRPQHRRSQSVGSIDMIDVLPSLEKQHSVPYHSPFTSKFKKSIKYTRNTIKKVFGTKKDGVEYSVVKSTVPTITTTPEERIVKLSQSSEHSSASPCQSDPGRVGDERVEAETHMVRESVQVSRSEMNLPIDLGQTREVVSDDASTPGPSISSIQRRKKTSYPHAQILTRRKSSPTLTCSKEEMLAECRRPITPEMPRSMTTPQFSDLSPKDDKIRGRTAWGKVKDIIHTRKDSLKKRSRKSDENRRSTTDAILDRKSAEPMKSPKLDEQTTKVASSSDTKLNEMTDKEERVLPTVTQDVKRSSPSHCTEHAHTTTALKELVGNLSDEFNRKMMEWERRKKHEKRQQTSSIATSSTGSVGDRLSELGAEQNRPQPRKISHTTSFPVKLRSGERTSPTRDAAQITLESLQKGMSDSFNRKMLEWEKMRSGQQTDGYMSVEGIRREVPWKSRSEKKTKAEKEKLRMERLREKQLLKVERERQKLERDRQRLQREQQRTMRRAEELERKKEQLEDYGLLVDGGHSKGHSSLSYQQSYPYSSNRRHRYKYVNVGEYKIEGVSDEFAKRLQTWEEKKHKGKDCFHAWDQHEKSYSKYNEVGDIVIPPKFKEGQPPLPIVIRSSQGMPEHLENIQIGPQIVRVEPTYQRATLCTHETQTSPQATQGQKEDKQFQFDDPITELRNRNSFLSQILRQKEYESQSLQDDVEGLNRALRRMNESYTKEIASYKHQLWATSNWGQMSEQSKFVAEAVNELRIRVEQLEDIHCMEARRRPFGLDSSKNDKERKPTQGMFETPGRYKNIVDYVKKLHAQISDLKKGICERDDVLNKFRKHLSLEEVNKLLLNADIQRRDLELKFYKKKHKHGVVRRHCTFAGQDFCMRQGCDEKQAFKTWPKYRARCVDKIPTTFIHGNFNPESTERDSDIADVLRTCGITSEQATAEKHQDILNGNSALPSSRSLRSVATQCAWDPEIDRYGDHDHWLHGDLYHPAYTNVRISPPGMRSRLSDRDSDSERRSRIDYGRRQMRDAFFSTVVDTSSASPSRLSDDRSRSPSYRHHAKSPVSDDGSKSSFKVRSATYFSPKPYNKGSPYLDDPYRLEPPQFDPLRRVGPLRKLHSTSELMAERRTMIAGRYQTTEVRHSSLMDRKAREDYFLDISQRRNQLLQQQELGMSQTNIVSGVDVQSIAQAYGQDSQDQDAGGVNVSAKELPQEGTVRRLTEVFVSGIDHNAGYTRSRHSAERMTEAMHRKLSMEIPKEGTVQKRLEEFIPLQGQSSQLSPTMRRRQSEIPKEGTVQKRLEELKMYSETRDDRAGPDGKESRKSDGDEQQGLLPVGRKDTFSSTDEDYSSKGQSDDEAFAAQTKVSHSSILLRPQPIGSQRERSKRLSPMEMLVRGTVSLNLDVVSPRYEDTEQNPDEPPLSPGTSTKRRSWFARSFFKSQK